MGDFAIPLPTRRATVHFAQILAPELRAGDLILLSGGLGAGKTFFTRALLRALDVPSGVPITSPTFTLIHEYEGRVPIRHSDAYRLRDDVDVASLGLAEERDRGALVIVEWGEPYDEVLGSDGLLLRFELSPDRGRVVDVSSTGPRGLELCHAARASLAPAP